MIEFTTPELSALGLAVFLHIALMVLFAVRANMELPSGYALGPRDEDPATPLSVTTARIRRAMNNSFESLILFTPAVLLVVLTRQTSALTLSLCGVFLVARLLYIPAYAFGWVPWRSLIWGVGLLATLAILVIGLI